jgi:predicted O-linked N-acetylglucosamine transferase (SPINDLY family)
MANRLKYHDRKSFFVKTFILEKNPADAMTEKIREWSDESIALPVKNFSVLPVAAKAIRESNLDLVIYGDIGMDNITYQLGAMHLAPVQAVLVGHGTTTGLSSIDYYISGDHEPANAQEHYVEQLIRLPNAGAAQLPPAQTDKVLSRADYGIPEDAVVFISCANGLKHIPERDALLAEILQQAPNAYILLKPYMSPNQMDAKFTNRLLAAAQRVGAADRMKIAPPLPQAGDLMAFLQLGDVQLDTYPYGGWTTNLEALYYHLPIVTQQGDIARSRWGAGLLQAMGIEEGIAHDEQSYVDWAVRFAKEPELRERVSARIAEMAPQVLFNGEAAQPSYEQALRQMIEQKEKKARKAKKTTSHKNKKHS